MKKYILIFTLYTSFLFSATPEQVEQYLSVSNAEEELLALESQFSMMQNSFKKEDNASETYDMQMLSLRFRDYLQRKLSDDEMEEVLENYKNVVLLQFSSAVNEAKNHDANITYNYVNTLKASSEATERISLVEEISKELYSKESMLVMFDDLLKPLIMNGIGGDNMSEEELGLAREDYLEKMIESSKHETLYASKDFSTEELEELLKIAKTTAIDHETKAVFGAMAYALKEFFMSMANRYDVSVHQPQGGYETNDTK